MLAVVGGDAPREVALRVKIIESLKKHTLKYTKRKTWNNLCVIMVLVTATHFLFLTTHNQSEQSVMLSVSESKQQKNNKENQHKVTNAQIAPQIFNSFFVFVFFLFQSFILTGTGSVWWRGRHGGV